MGGSERRRSARHLLGVTAEVHVGPDTVMAVVHDVSRHGMGLVLPGDVKIAIGDIVWILATSVASYAITATVRRIADGIVGVELDEVLAGEALDVLDSLPLADAVASIDLGQDGADDTGDVQTSPEDAGDPTDEIPDPRVT